MPPPPPHQQCGSEAFQKFCMATVALFCCDDFMVNKPAWKETPCSLSTERKRGMSHSPEALFHGFTLFCQAFYFTSFQETCVSSCANISLQSGQLLSEMQGSSATRALRYILTHNWLQSLDTELEWVSGNVIPGHQQLQLVISTLFEQDSSHFSSSIRQFHTFALMFTFFKFFHNIQHLSSVFSPNCTSTCAVDLFHGLQQIYLRVPPKTHPTYSMTQCHKRGELILNPWNSNASLHTYDEQVGWPASPKI